MQLSHFTRQRLTFVGIFLLTSAAFGAAIQFLEFSDDSDACTVIMFTSWTVIPASMIAAFLKAGLFKRTFGWYPLTWLVSFAAFMWGGTTLFIFVALFNWSLVGDVFIFW